MDTLLSECFLYKHSRNILGELCTVWLIIQMQLFLCDSNSIFRPNADDLCRFMQWLCSTLLCLFCRVCEIEELQDEQRVSHLYRHDDIISDPEIEERNEPLQMTELDSKCLGGKPFCS